MNIPFRELRNRLDTHTQDCKTTHAYDNSVIAKSFLALLGKIINRFETATEYEVGIFIRSFDKWLDRKDVDNCAENSIVPAIGDVLMVEWNIGYKPELAYTHPGLVINIVNDMLVVAPISSIHVDSAYHPNDNPNGDKLYRKVTVSDGFLKECSVHIAEIKTISKSRVISRIVTMRDNNGNLTPLFDEIKNDIFHVYFSNEINRYEEVISNLTLELEREKRSNRKMQSNADKHRLRNIWLKKEKQRLEKQVKKLKDELTAKKDDNII